MDGSALPAIDALLSCDAIGKAPRAAGYRGSDFVHWHSLTEQSEAPNVPLCGVLRPFPRLLAHGGRSVFEYTA